MSKHGEIYDSVERAVARLHVLKNSCAGVLSSEKSKPNSLWFQGAEAMLHETVNELQTALQTMESGEAEETSVSEAVEEEASVAEELVDRILREKTGSEEEKESPKAKRRK